MVRRCVLEGGNFLWPGVRAGYNVTIEAQGPSGEAVVMTTLALQPRIFSISPLLADFESEAIISQAAPIMVASPVMVRTNKQSAADRAKSAAKRTSTQARLPLGGNTVAAQIERRGHELLRVGVEHGEPLQVLRYDAGEKYDAHYDFFNTSLYGGQVSITRILLSSQVHTDLLVTHHAGSSFGDHGRRAESLRDASLVPRRARVGRRRNFLPEGRRAGQAKDFQVRPPASDARPQGCAEKGLSHTVVSAARTRSLSFRMALVVCAVQLQPATGR